MLSYDDAEHRYYWFGVEIPSLSKLMEQTGWGRGDDLANVPEKVLETARTRGEQVHSAINKYLSADPTFASELSEASEPHFNSFLEALPGLPITAEGWGELPIGGWCGYGTTPDWVDTGAIIEFKATYRIHPSVWIQLAGQHFALNDAAPQNRERLVVHLQKDGKKAKVTRDKEPKITYAFWRNELDKIQWKRDNKWR